MTDEQWFRVLDVTLNSVFRMTRAFLPSMYAQKSGVIVNNASVLGWRAQKGQAHYAAAKAGVMVLIAGGNVVRFAPALNVSEDEVTTGLDRFAAACEHFVSRGSS